MARVTVLVLRAWLVALLGLVVATAGVTSFATSGSVTSPTRMTVAAAILSAYAAVVGVATTPRAARTRLRCLLFGGVVPVVVAALNSTLVASSAGTAVGAINALPWLTGPLLAYAAGPYLPALRLPRLRRREP